MVRPQNLGGTLIVTGPVAQLSYYLVRELRPGDMVLSNMPLRATISTPSELSTRRLVKAAEKYPGVRVVQEVPNVQSEGPDRRDRQ